MDVNVNLGDATIHTQTRVFLPTPFSLKLTKEIN